MEAFAKRYPFVTEDTLFNEPFATLFLCGHEGVWPPYGRGIESFVRILRIVLPAVAPLVSRALMQGSSQFVAEAIRLATFREDAISQGDRLRYADILRDPDRAHATVQLYRTFLLREVPRLGQYLEQRLTVPTRLLVGDHDPVCTPALLDGWQDHADDMTVERVGASGHFLPEETPHEVATVIRSLFS